MNNPTDRLLASAAAYMMDVVSVYVSRYGTQCESPIERIMLEALCLQGWISNGAFPRINDSVGKFTTIRPQAQIGSFRVDFLVIPDDNAPSLVIECDGHEFHERTKEQAAKDRSRDRALQSMGLGILRFTGSEIWRDPWRCAVEVEDHIFATLKQEKAAAND